jgi:hypothetical protein
MCGVLHIFGTRCDAQQDFGSSGQDPIFVKSWIFGQLCKLFLSRIPEHVGFVSYVDVQKIRDPWSMSLAPSFEASGAQCKKLNNLGRRAVYDLTV